MARTAKKQKELTPEEKLARALVPAEDQPYSIPENWCWTTIETINSFHSRSLDPRKHPSDYYELYSVPSYDNDYPEIIQGSTIKSSKQVVAKDDVLICKINPRINRVWKVSQYTDYPLLASSEWIVVRNRLLNPDYLMWYFKTPVFREYMLSNVSGVGGSLMRAQPKYVKTYPLPFPPLAEQQRIVDRIESLFSKLDEAKEKAQSFIDSYEDRKSAILHQAFSGELTKEWRKDNSVAFDSWQKRSVDSICHSLKYGTAKKSEKEGQVVVIRMGNLQQGEIDWTNLSFSTDKEDIEKYRLQPNDVLFNRTNSSALVGKTSIYRGEYPAIYAGYLIKLDYDHEIVLGDYLNYALNTQEAKEYCNTVKTDGVNQSNINAKKIGAYVFTVPTIQEQEKIVDILKNLIEKEKMVKETAEQIIKMIDTMKKNILAQAFCGQLETVDTNDEPAERILKKMLSEC